MIEFPGSAGFVGSWFLGFLNWFSLWLRPWEEGGRFPLNGPQRYKGPSASKKLRRLYRRHLLWYYQTLPNPSTYMWIRRKNDQKVIDANPGFMKKARSLLVQKARPATGCSTCLGLIAATVLPVKDSNKLTLEQTLKCPPPMPLRGVLKHLPNRWLSNAWLTHYQDFLLNPPRVQYIHNTAFEPCHLAARPEPGLASPRLSGHPQPSPGDQTRCQGCPFAKGWDKIIYRWQ